MCGATDFFERMRVTVLEWWNQTGVSAVDQDGAESDTPCANVSHTYHHGVNDSIWMQYKAVRRTFQDYLSAPANTAGNHSTPVPGVGFIGGMPGSVIEAGQSKVPGGYRSFNPVITIRIRAQKKQPCFLVCHEPTSYTSCFFLKRDYLLTAALDLD